MASGFERTTRILAPQHVVFDTALSVDFHKESFESTGEQIVGGVRSGSMRLGETVRWRAKHFGIWFEMTSLISELERPECFVDEQVDGPFRRFHHVHRFRSDGEVTVMEDVVTFEAPLGPLGRLVERLVLRRYLARLIDLRNAELARATESGTAPSD